MIRRKIPIEDRPELRFFLGEEEKYGFQDLYLQWISERENDVITKFEIDRNGFDNLLVERRLHPNIECKVRKR